MLFTVDSTLIAYKSLTGQIRGVLGQTMKDVETKLVAEIGVLGSRQFERKLKNLAFVYNVTYDYPEPEGFITKTYRITIKGKENAVNQFIDEVTTV